MNVDFNNLRRIALNELIQVIECHNEKFGDIGLKINNLRSSLISICAVYGDDFDCILKDDEEIPEAIEQE